MSPFTAAILGVAVGLLFCGVGVCILLRLMLAIEARHRETMQAFGGVLVRVIARVHDLELKVRLDG